MTDEERKARNREKTARFRARHRERALAQGRVSRKKWYAAHRDEARAINKAYHAIHQEERRSRDKARQQRPDREGELSERRARWLKRKEKQNAQRRLRRASNIEAAKQREAAVRDRPGYRERAVARTAEWNRKNPERARALLRKQDAKRRAIEREVFVEVVDHHVVFERDKGQCGICKEPVDPMSPWEIDHIVPILRGGLHSYANVQLAHRKCNRSKGARCA